MKCDFCVYFAKQPSDATKSAALNGIKQMNFSGDTLIQACRFYIVEHCGLSEQREVFKIRPIKNALPLGQKVILVVT